MSQAEGDGRALGPSYRWSHVQLQSHRPFSEPIAALQSGLIRVFSFCCLHISLRETPAAIFFSLHLFLFPLPFRVVKSDSSCFSCVCVCACVCVAIKVSSSSSVRPPVCQGRENQCYLLDCSSSPSSKPQPQRRQPSTPDNPSPGQANLDCSVAVQRSASYLTCTQVDSGCSQVLTAPPTPTPTKSQEPKPNPPGRTPTPQAPSGR